MNLSNIWKAWLSTAIGVVIPFLTGLITLVSSGHIEWDAVKTSLVATGILLVTDLLKEVQKGITGTTTTTDSTTTTTDNTTNKQ